MSDWSFLSLALATHGIQADVEETTVDIYEPDPWRPSPGSQAVVVIMDIEAAGRLVGVLEKAFARHLDGEPR